MSMLATAKTNNPSKVHYTEYIVAEDEPEEQSRAPGSRITPRTRTAFMKALVVKIFRTKSSGRDAIKKVQGVLP
ncbi:MAG TPA: hypothetical protein VLE73_03655 [Candidatus Saccharimonadales bacterium]|nr:hypothetical protein [Candidatus Saccharimonadales bacterium]